jgi:CheY-like chemotaxis protein
MVNLVGNAVKFTAAGEVTVEVGRGEVTGGRFLLHLTVADTGIGIPEDKQKIIFEAFGQADGSTTRNFGGTGLGLTISQCLARAMGGGIRVTSEPGKGSMFELTASVGSVVEIAEEAGETCQVPLAEASVLVVDDNLTNRRILAEMLRGWKMRPELADSGRQAMSMIRLRMESGQPYDIVLTDLHMPEMDGFELVEALRSCSACTRQVLMLTSGERPGDLAHSRELGIAAYLTKPVRRADLRAAICAAIVERRQFDGTIAHSPKPVVSKRSDPDREAIASLRILLAEDNKVNQLVAKGILKRAGHTVEVANNGAEVQPLLDACPFDVVLMDIQMPGMDGFEATALVRERERKTGAHLPIIAMTAHAMSGYKERCLAAGMDGYVTKPVSADLLLKALAESRKLHRQPVDVAEVVLG